jgi:hypothetical protein
MISPSMMGSCVHHRSPINPALTSGRNPAATTATASRRAAIAVSLAGLPTARCGRAPTIMAIAVTAMTCDAQGLAGSSPILSTRAYAIAPAVAIGAASRSPGRFSRSSSPNATSAPNASAAWTSWTPLTAVCATDQISSSPANAARSQ